MKNKREKDMKNRFADTGKSYAGYFLRFVFCLVLTASALSSQAQSRNQVSGKVTDTAGEPLIGATVVVVGTTTGTTTGIDGSYTINAAADLIRAHECSFAIYPEGTRSKSGELLPWHAGSLKIAQKANVPIVVATIEGTERIAHNVPWRRTHVYLRIREVIPAETVKAAKTTDLTEGIRSKMLAELGK